MSQKIMIAAIALLAAAALSAPCVAQAEEWVEPEYFDDDFAQDVGEDSGEALDEGNVEDDGNLEDDGYVEDEGNVVVREAPPPAVYRRPPVVVPVVPEYVPPVYGWVYERPPSCGQYRYWNGNRCLDARDDPPYVGPRW